MAKDTKNKAIGNKKGAANDKRFNAEKYKQGAKPSKHSEYFGKSYSELKRESKKNNGRI